MNPAEPDRRSLGGLSEAEVTARLGREGYNHVPVIRDLFRFSFLHPDDLGICLLAGAGPIVVFEGFKATSRRLRSSS